jgi:heme A synthase
MTAVVIELYTIACALGVSFFLVLLVAWELSKKKAADQKYLDSVYADRARLVQLAAALAIRCGITAGVPVRGDDDKFSGFTVLTINLKEGQCGWHIKDSDFVANFPQITLEYDGHTDKDKARRIEKFVNALLLMKSG